MSIAIVIDNIFRAIIQGAPLRPTTSRFWNICMLHFEDLYKGIPGNFQSTKNIVLL